jgi:hypothetical protein
MPYRHRPAFRAGYVALLPFALLMVGCGSAASEVHAVSPTAAAERLAVEANGDPLTGEQVRAVDIHGNHASFGRYAEQDGLALRGLSYGRGVNITVARDRAVGLLGRAPVDLTVSREGDDLHYTGLIGGNPSSFWVNKRAIRGTIGSCGYDLQWSGEAYEGASGCGRAERMTSFVLPMAFASWDPAELGAALGIILDVPAADGRVQPEPPPVASSPLPARHDAGAKAPHDTSSPRAFSHALPPPSKPRTRG